MKDERPGKMGSDTIYQRDPARGTQVPDKWCLTPFFRPHFSALGLGALGEL